MKKCKMCKEEKEFTEFRPSKKHSDGYLNSCRLCVSIKRREYYLNNYDSCRESNKKYYEKNKEKIYLKLDKERKKINDDKYSKNNKEKISDTKKKYYENNKEEILSKRKLYYENNKEKINKSTDRKRELKRDYYKKRKHQYVWREILRRTITQLKLNKNQTTLDILGYGYDVLKSDMKSKFKEGMSWLNHGEWHIDHIIPISLFKSETPSSIVNRLDNLRPIWAKDNLIKQNKLESEYEYLIDEFRDYLI